MSRRCRAGLSGGGSLAETLAGSPCDCERLSSGTGGTNICVEPLVIGSNVLRDPGFELHIGKTGGGPDGDEIPNTLSGGGLNWPSELIGAASITASEASGWVNKTGTGAFWKLSTANPDSGAYHARIIAPAAPRKLGALGFLTCEPLSTTRVPVSGRVSGGSLVTFSVRSMADATTGTPKIRLELHFLQNAGGLPGASNEDPYQSALFNLTTSYATYTFSAMAPALSYFYHAHVLISSATGRTIDVDNGITSIQPAGSSFTLCSLTSTVTIVNTTTETSLL